MPWLSLIVAFALLIGSVFLFFGGLGPLMMIGAIFDRSEISPVVPWAIAAIYLLTWWGGIVVCFVRFRVLGEQMKTSFDRAPTIFDGMVALGHLLLLGALVNVLLRKLQLWDWDLFYALLMAAAFFYSAGLGGLALTGRWSGRPASRASASLSDGGGESPLN